MLFSEDPVNAVLLRMKVIETQFKLDDEEDTEADSNAH
jgi:hypothetical protein